VTEELWENVSLSVQHAPVLCHLIQTCSRAYKKGCRSAAATAGQGSFLYTNTAEVQEERRSSKWERWRTADDRVIKARSTPPGRASGCNWACWLLLQHSCSYVVVCRWTQHATQIDFVPECCVALPSVRRCAALAM